MSASYVKEYSFKAKSKKTKEELNKAEDLRQKARDEDSRMVKGVFKNVEAPGGNLSFSKKKYKEDPVRTYSFEDGGTYEIPLWVAKELNQSCSVPLREYAKNAKGESELFTVIRSRRQRYQFLSTEYM